MEGLEGPGSRGEGGGERFALTRVGEYVTGSASRIEPPLFSLLNPMPLTVPGSRAVGGGGGGGV